jgi:hypothetical protein
MNKRLIDVVKKALEQDNTIAVDISELDKAEGKTEEYMEYLGLKRNDLKKLERAGLALRGYTKNVYLPGDKMPNGKEVPEGSRYHGRGHSLRWLLIGVGGSKDASTMQDMPKAQG